MRLTEAKVEVERAKRKVNEARNRYVEDTNNYIQALEAFKTIYKEKEEELKELEYLYEESKGIAE